MLGDDLGDLLGTRIPGDHSRQVLADHYAARLRPAKVMDLGCGAGDSVDLFRVANPDVRWVGVDIEESPEVAERTRGDAEFVTFDGEHLAFDDGSFELIYCKQVLEHVERPRELLREVARVLEPGGWLPARPHSWRPFTRAASSTGRRTGSRSPRRTPAWRWSSYDP